MSHRKGCECGKDHTKDDFHNATIQSQGMTKIQHRDKVKEICEQLYQVGILHKSKETQISNYDGKEESAFALTQKFMDKVIEHYKIQDQVEYMDKKSGFESKTDYGELDRNTYVFGIAINDFVTFSKDHTATPTNCETCKNLVIKKRGEEDTFKMFNDHLENDHPEIYKRQQEIGKHIKEWIIVIRDFMEIEMKQKKEWRSN